MKKKRILVVSPHPDDETLGVGGTIAKLANTGNDISVLTISGHLPPLYKRRDYELTVKEAKKAFKILAESFNGIRDIKISATEFSFIEN